MPPRTPPFIAETTVGRRTVLEWLGRSTVLALSAELLAACGVAPGDGAGAGDGGPPGDGAGAGADGPAADGAPHDAGVAPGRDGGHDAAPADVACAPDAGAGFPFAPGTLEPRLQSWGVITADDQDLQSLLQTWRLTVDGLCAAPRSLGFADVVCLPRQDQVTDFHCVEGWSVYDVPWNGVHLQRLLDLVGPRPAATHVTFHSVGGIYTESLPLSVALEPRTLLGYGVGGNTVPLDHGFPLRLVVPRLLGYKNAKYVERIELTDAPVEGFWVRAGYPYAGEVPPERLREGKY